MAISTTNDFSGPLYPNGATTVFPFTFTAPTIGEVAVVLRDASGDPSTVDPADYTVTLGAGSGGNVTFGAAPASGTSLYILLDPDFTQEIVFEDGTGWTAAPTNQEADRSASRDQYLKGQVDRAVKVLVGDTAPTLRPGTAGQVAYFDSDGNISGADSDIGSSAEILAAADVATAAADAAAEDAAATADVAADIDATIAALTISQFADPAAASGEATGAIFACAQEYGLAHDIFAKTASGHDYTRTITIDAAAVALATVERNWLRDNPLPAGVFHYNAGVLALNDRRGVPQVTSGPMGLDRILIADVFNSRNESGSLLNPDTFPRDTGLVGPDTITPAMAADYDATSDNLYIANAAGIADTAGLVDTIRMGGIFKRISGDTVIFRIGSQANINGTDSNPAYADFTPGADWVAPTPAVWVGRNADHATGLSVRVATGEAITLERIGIAAAWIKDDWGGTDTPSFTALKDWHDRYPAKAPFAARGTVEGSAPYWQLTDGCATLNISLNKQIDFSAGFTFYATINTTSNAGAISSIAQGAVSFTRQRGASNPEKNQDLLGQIGVYAYNGKMYAYPILSSVVSSIVAKLADRGDIFFGMTADRLSSDPTKANYTVYINGVVMGLFQAAWVEPDPEMIALGANDLGQNRFLDGTDRRIDYGAQFGWAARALDDDEFIGLAKGADAYLKAHGVSGGLNISVCWAKGGDSTRAFGECPDHHMQDLRPIGEIDMMEARGGSFWNLTPKTDPLDFTGTNYNDAWREALRIRTGATALKMGYVFAYPGVGSVNDLVPTRALGDGSWFTTWEEGRAAIFAYAAADRLAIIAAAQEGPHGITEAAATAKMLYLAQTIIPRADYFGGAQETIRQEFNDDLLNNGFAEANGLDGYFDRQSFVPEHFTANPGTYSDPAYAGLDAHDAVALNADLNGDNTCKLQGNGSVHWADQAGRTDSTTYEYDEERNVLARGGIS